MKPWMLGIPACAIAVFGAAFAVDARYQHKADAEAALARLSEDNEQVGLENRLAIYQIELAQLRAKQSPTPDDLDRISYLVEAIKKIQERLAGIVS